MRSAIIREVSCPKIGEVMNVEGVDGKFQWFKLVNFELADSDATLPINQLVDRNYENPA